MDYIIAEFNRLSARLKEPDGLVYLDSHRFSIEDFVMNACLPTLAQLAVQSQLFKDAEVSVAMRELRLAAIHLISLPSTLCKVSVAMRELRLLAESPDDQDDFLGFTKSFGSIGGYAPNIGGYVSDKDKDKDPSRSSPPRATIGQVQPSLYFDSVLSLADLLFARNGNFLLIYI